MTLAVPSEPPLYALSVSALAARCTSEISKYRCGEPYNDQYCVELFRRAMVQHDPLAWEIVQQRFQETMLRWMRAHPQKELACRLDSEERHSRKTAMRGVRSGRSFRTCFPVNVSSVSPTCSFTAASSHERLFASVQKSSVR